MLEHVEGYEEVPRAGPCLDSAWFQISGCAFRHGDALCTSVACAAAARADGKYVMFIPMADANPPLIRRSTTNLAASMIAGWLPLPKLSVE